MDNSGNSSPVKTKEKTSVFQGKRRQLSKHNMQVTNQIWEGKYSKHMKRN